MSRRGGLAALLPLTAGLSVFYYLARRQRASLPEKVPRELVAINDTFHRAYDDKTGRAELEAPVMLVLTDTLVVHHRGARQETPLLSEEFHLLKAVAHLPVGVFATLHERGKVRVDEQRLRRLREQTSSLSERLLVTLQGLKPTAAEATNTVVMRTQSFLDGAQVKGISEAALERFAREMGAHVLTLTHEATLLQLATLHAGVEDAVSRFSTAERRALQVIVTGDHQARRRSLAMQYFESRLGEEPGDETRLAFGEGISAEKDALALVGKRRMDFSLARAFFGDEKRLQRDVLGDAARDILAARRLRRIGTASNRRPRKRSKR